MDGRSILRSHGVCAINKSMASPHLKSGAFLLDTGATAMFDWSRSRSARRHEPRVENPTCPAWEGGSADQPGFTAEEGGLWVFRTQSGSFGVSIPRSSNCATFLPCSAMSTKKSAKRVPKAPSYSLVIYGDSGCPSPHPGELGRSCKKAIFQSWTSDECDNLSACHVRGRPKWSHQMSTAFRTKVMLRCEFRDQSISIYDDIYIIYI